LPTHIYIKERRTDFHINVEENPSVEESTEVNFVKMDSRGLLESPIVPFISSSIVKQEEDFKSEDGVGNDSVEPRREEVTESMTTAEEQTFTSLLEEEPFVEESVDNKTDIKWDFNIVKDHVKESGDVKMDFERESEQICWKEFKGGEMNDSVKSKRRRNMKREEVTSCISEGDERTSKSKRKDGKFHDQGTLNGQ
jgi:hypothetical protein